MTGCCRLTIFPEFRKSHLTQTVRLPYIVRMSDKKKTKRIDIRLMPATFAKLKRLQVEAGGETYSTIIRRLIEAAAMKAAK